MSRQLCHAVSNLTDPYRSDPISNGPVSSHSTGNEDLVSFAWWGRNESIRTDCLIDPETCRNIYIMSLCAHLPPEPVGVNSFVFLTVAEARDPDSMPCR